MNKNNGFAPIIILFIILILGTAGYFAYKNGGIKLRDSVSPTPSIDPTADWKTFSNEKYHFSVKYPPYFASINKPVKCEVIPFETNFDDNIQFNIFSYDCLNTFQIEPIKNKKGLSPLDYWKMAIAKPNGKLTCNDTDTSCKNTFILEEELITEDFGLESIQVDNMDALKVRPIVNYRAYIKPHIYISFGNYIYKINYSEAVQINELVLSSFRFLPDDSI